MILNLNSTWSELKRKRVLFSEEVLPVIDRKHRRSQQTINKRRQTATNGRTLQLISVNDVETSVWMQQKQLDRSFERNQQRHERHQNEKREREKALARKLWIRLQMISSLQIVGQSVAFAFSAFSNGFSNWLLRLAARPEHESFQAQPFLCNRVQTWTTAGYRVSISHHYDCVL